jgi:hypothetical protein
MDLAMAGCLAVQSLPRRVRICTLPASSRACIRYPSNLISCSQSGLSGAFSTGLASCGLIKVGGEVGSIRPARVVFVGVARGDFAIAAIYQEFAILSGHYVADRMSPHIQTKFRTEPLSDALPPPSKATCTATHDGSEARRR